MLTRTITLSFIFCMLSCSSAFSWYGYDFINEQCCATCKVLIEAETELDFFEAYEGYYPYVYAHLVDGIDVEKYDLEDVGNEVIDAYVHYESNVGLWERGTWLLSGLHVLWACWDPDSPSDTDAFLKGRYAGCCDVTDDISDEYNTYYVGWVPDCLDFTQSVPTLSHYNFANWNTGNDWWLALLREPMVANVYCVVSNHGSVPPLTSGYRNPAHQKRADPDHMNSQHVHGNAADLGTPTSPNDTEWNQLWNSAKSGYCGIGCVEPRNLTPSHFHVDYRTSCPYGW
jgi:hypothetical protein